MKAPKSGIIILLLLSINAFKYLLIMPN